MLLLFLIEKDSRRLFFPNTEAILKAEYILDPFVYEACHMNHSIAKDWVAPFEQSCMHYLLVPSMYLFQHILSLMVVVNYILFGMLQVFPDQLPPVVDYLIFPAQ